MVRRRLSCCHHLDTAGREGVHASLPAHAELHCRSGILHGMRGLTYLPRPRCKFLAATAGVAYLAVAVAGACFSTSMLAAGEAQAAPRVPAMPGMDHMPMPGTPSGAVPQASATLQMQHAGSTAPGSERPPAEHLMGDQRPAASHVGVDKTYIGPALPVGISEQEADAGYGVANVAAEAKANTRKISTAEHRAPVPLDVRFHGTLYQVQHQDHEYEVGGVGVTELDQDLLFDTDVTQSGLVRALYVFPGQMIERNQPIMSIFSPERVNVQHMFLADFSKDAGNQISLQYYSSFGSTESFLEGARANMRWWGFTDAQMKHLLDTGEITDDYVVPAQESGYVIQTRQSPGGLVVAGDRGDQSFVLAGETVLNQARLEVVWGMMFVKPGDYDLFPLGQQVDVTIGEGNSQWTTTGTIVHKHGNATNQTRRADFHVLLDNANHALRPGTFIRLRRTLHSSGLWVPASAVLYLPSGAGVIRKDASGFTLVPVDIGVQAGDKVEILSGVKADDDIVASPRSELDPDARTPFLYSWH